MFLLLFFESLPRERMCHCSFCFAEAAATSNNFFFFVFNFIVVDDVLLLNKCVISREGVGGELHEVGTAAIR